VPVDSTPIADSSFEIQANHLIVRTDSADAYAETSANYLVVPPTVGPFDSPAIHSKEDAYTAAVVVGTDSRPGRTLYVFRLDGCEASVLAQGAVAEVSSISESKAVSHFNNEWTITRDVSQTIQVTPKAGTEVQVAGCFLVVLWEWDAAWTATEGSGTLWSGKGEGQGASDPTGATNAEASVSPAQQIYIEVRNGTFTIHGNDVRPTRVFLDSVEVEASDLALTDADGQITMGDVPLPVHGQTVHLHGALDATVKRNGSRLGLQVVGVDSADADGQTLVSAMVQPPSASWLPWVLGFVGLGAVLVPAALLPTRRRKPARAHRLLAIAEQAWQALEARDGATAEARARKLLDWKPRSATANFLLGSALGLLGRYEEAASRHEQATLAEEDWPSRNLLAWNRMLGAVAMVRHLESGGRRFTRERIVDWMRNAVALDPAMRSELAAHHLDEYLDDVAYN
jgi:hypothetical protein